MSPFGPPTGRVVSKRVLNSGEQSIKVSSYETFQPGNKVSTSHGQKGVASSLVDYQDMAVCYMRDGSMIVPDVVMAVSSIVSRQTVGQIYESGASLERVKDSGLSPVIDPDQTAALGEDVSVMDGTTGQFFESAMYGNGGAVVLQETAATMGFIRMFNQSQMTRDISLRIVP